MERRNRAYVRSDSGRAGAAGYGFRPHAGEDEKLQQEKSALLEQQSLVGSVLDSTLEGIVLATSGGTTLLYNSAAQHVLGSDGVPQVSWPAHRPSDEDVVRLSNGRLVERSTRAVPGYGQLFVLRDVTDRPAAEEERLRLERVVQTMKHYRRPGRHHHVYQRELR